MALGNQLTGAVLRDLIELPVTNELDELRQRGQEVRLAAADRHPLRGQRVAADLPAPVHLTEHALVGHEHVVDVDGVEHRVAGELRSGLTSTPSLFMSSRKYVMPLCFGALGSVRASSAPHCENCAAVVQIFWPVMRHPPSVRVAFVDRPARSEPAPGSENS